MTTEVEIKIASDSATPAIARFKEQTQPSRLAVVVGPAAAKLTRGWLRALPSNKRGWPTTNFWQRAVKATNWQAAGDSALVSINQIGVRQRFHGGRIAPVARRALTIPISPEAYGKTVSDFPGAFLLKTKKGAFIVQRGESISARGNIVKASGKSFARKRVVAALEFLFVLSRGVNQKPNPNVLPPDDAYRTTAHQAIKEALKL